MAETANIAVVADKIQNDIFRVFYWGVHPQKDTNFECVLEHHTTPQGKKKVSHPGDVVFHYFDPYLGKRVYLHTDLKSYSKSSLKVGKIREALHSLAWTLECAACSESWRGKFLHQVQEPYEIRGLLFVANHDNKAPDDFDAKLQAISKGNIPLAKSQQIHVLGPNRIRDLVSIAMDIKLSLQDQVISENYRFFYPDLTLWKRHTVDDQRSAATIETIMSPYFMLRHDVVRDKKDPKTILQRAGSVVYYSRRGETVEEFVYLLDSLLRFQLVKASEQVRIRVFNSHRSPHFKNNFEKAKEKYCADWGFQGDRAAEIQEISIDAIAQIQPNYVPDEIGWRDK